MRLLYVAKASITTETGGAELRTEQVTRELADQGHDVTVLCGQTDHQLDQRVVDGNREIRQVRCVPTWLTRYQSLSFYLTLCLFPFVSFPFILREIYAEPYDVIVDTMSPFPTLAIVAGRLTGMPVMGVVHGFFGMEMYKTYDPITATIQLLAQNFLRIFEYQQLIVPTSSVRSSLIDYGIPEGKISVIPNGVNVESYFSPEDDGDNRIGDEERDALQLLVVGRVTKAKGQGTILRAIERVRDRHGVDVTLHIVGSGPRLNKVRALVEERGLSDHVVIHGYVSEEEKIKLIQSCDLFVYASKYESFGIVLLEALTAGTPVVAVSQPAYQDFFDEGRHGVLVSDSPNEIASATASVASNMEQWQSRVTQEAEKLADRYSWENIALKTQKELEGVVSDLAEPTSTNSMSDLL